MKIFDLIVAVCFLSLIIMAGKNINQVLGGSMAFLLYFPAFYFVSYFMPMKKEMTHLALATVLILTLNYLHYMQISQTYSPDIIFYSYNLLTLGILVNINFMISGLLISIKDIPSSASDKVKILWKDFKWLVNQYCGAMPIVYTFLLSICFWQILKIRDSAQITLQMIPTCFLVVPAFMITLFFLIKKWGENKLNFIITKETLKPKSQAEDFNYNRSYIYLTLFIGITGSIIEFFSRKNFLLWLISFVTINIFIILVWRISSYKYNYNVNYDEVPVGKILFTSKNLIRLIIIHSFIALSLVFGLIGYFLYCLRT